jgi:hypothetical protein
METEESKDQCYICYEESKNNVMLECNHNLCLKCFQKIQEDNFKCPTCRKEYEIYNQSSLRSEVIHVQGLIEQQQELRNIDSTNRMMFKISLVVLLIFVGINLGKCISAFRNHITKD